MDEHIKKKQYDFIKALNILESAIKNGLKEEEVIQRFKFVIENVYKVIELTIDNIYFNDIEEKVDYFVKRLKKRGLKLDRYIWADMEISRNKSYYICDENTVFNIAELIKNNYIIELNKLKFFYIKIL
ncbi:MAG: nucleotidyltransferase substrate binding protein [Paraclostridium sordellii]